MQSTKEQPGTQTTGKTSDNNTDVNQQDHISSQIEKKDPTNTEDSENSEDNDTSDVEEDGTPVLDEQDLEENNLTDEEADNVEWDPSGKGGL